MEINLEHSPAKQTNLYIGINVKPSAVHYIRHFILTNVYCTLSRGNAARFLTLLLYPLFGIANHKKSVSALKYLKRDILAVWPVLLKSFFQLGGHKDAINSLSDCLDIYLQFLGRSLTFLCVNQAGLERDLGHSISVDLPLATHQGCFRPGIWKKFFLQSGVVKEVHNKFIAQLSRYSSTILRKTTDTTFAVTISRLRATVLSRPFCHQSSHC